MFTLDQALKAVEGRREFVVNKYCSDRLVVINYVITLPDSFEGLRQEFRGVTFDAETGEIVSLPFHKFFNVNQKEHTQYHLLKDLKGVAYEKMDGSMVHFFKMPRGLPTVPWDIVGSTRMSSQTTQAARASILAMSSPVVKRLIEENIEDGYTPIFEYISPNNQIVVAYPRERLVYLNSRNRKTGEYKFDERFPDKAQRFDLSLSRAMESSEGLTEYEGWVFHLEGGLWVKQKTPWYLTRHHTVDVLMKPMYFLCEIALEEKMDDFMQDVPDRYRADLHKLACQVGDDYVILRENLLDADMFIRGKVGNVRKDYALYAKQHRPALFSGLMRLYDGKDPADFIKKTLMERYRKKYPNKLFAEMESDS